MTICWARVHNLSWCLKQNMRFFCYFGYRLSYPFVYIVRLFVVAYSMLIIYEKENKRWKSIEFRKVFFFLSLLCASISFQSNWSIYLFCMQIDFNVESHVKCLMRFIVCWPVRIAFSLNNSHWIVLYDSVIFIIISNNTKLMLYYHFRI